jgi:hypothetical protein
MTWSTLYAIDACSLLLFAISYYRNCYSKGYRIDIWHTQIVLFCVLPNMFMLPFAGGTLNALIVGPDFQAMAAALPKVFLITTVGFLSILAGGTLWRLQAGTGLRRFAAGVLDFGPRCSMMLMASRTVLLFQAALCIALQAAVLTFYFANNGFAFDLRAYTFANPALRPIASGISAYSVIIGSHCFARYLERKERVLLLSTFLLSAGLIFFGARSSLIFVFQNVLLCYLVGRRSSIGLFRLVCLVAFVLLTLFYLGNVREGRYSLAEFLSSLVVLAFYGNNLSDLRDFAWVYADWDHHLWLGKTYLAGVTAFVPRFASHFRDTWGVGVQTGTTIGVDPQVHPGLRPGAFGEGYFNFSWIGVILVGVLIGIIVKRVDIVVKRSLSGPQPSMTRAFASTMLLGVAASVAISANLSALYVLGCVYLFTWICRKTAVLFRAPAVLAPGNLPG